MSIKLEINNKINQIKNDIDKGIQKNPEYHEIVENILDMAHESVKATFSEDEEFDLSEINLDDEQV